MTLKKYIIKTIIIVSIALILAITVLGIQNYANTIISNYLAVGQLENDDVNYLFMDMYLNVGRPVMQVLFMIISSILGICFIYNTIKYINTIKDKCRRN